MDQKALTVPVDQSADTEQSGDEASKQAGENEEKEKSGIDLWDEAFSVLEKAKPKLVAAYRRLLVAEAEEESKQVDNSKSGREKITASSPAKSKISLDTQETALLDRKGLSDLISSKLQAAEDARLTFMVGDSEVIVSEQVDRIVNGIIYAKDFISSVASNEPHAALAWAGVSIVLPVCRHDAGSPEVQY